MSEGNGVIRIGRDEELELERVAFGNWISGLVDGEGHFSLNVRCEFPNRIRPSVEFTIGLRNDDIEVLQYIMEFLNCGQIYTSKGNGNKKPVAYYKVWKPSDLLNSVVPHFEEFPLRAKKGRELPTWRAGVELIERVSARKVRPLFDGLGTMPKWDKEELEEFNNLVSKLAEIREYKS